MQSPRAPPGGSDLVGLGPGMKIYVSNKHLSWFCWLGRFGERYWIVGSICPSFADPSIFQISPSSCLPNLWTQIHRKNFSMFSWFIRSELECNSADSTLVPSLEGSWWRHLSAQGETGYRSKVIRKESFQRWNRLLYHQASLRTLLVRPIQSHLPLQLPPPPRSSFLNHSLSLLELHSLLFICIFTSNSTSSTQYSFAVLSIPTSVSPPEPPSWVTSSTSGIIIP